MRTKIQRTSKTRLLVPVALLEKLAFGSGFKIVNILLTRVSRPMELPGRPGEFRPEPPTDPDVNLSIHPARATQRRLPPSIKTRSSSGCPLTPPDVGDRLPLLHGIAVGIPVAQYPRTEPYGRSLAHTVLILDGERQNDARGKDGAH